MLAGLATLTGAQFRAQFEGQYHEKTGKKLPLWFDKVHDMEHARPATAPPAGALLTTATTATTPQIRQHSAPPSPLIGGVTAAAGASPPGLKKVAEAFEQARKSKAEREKKKEGKGHGNTVFLDKIAASTEKLSQAVTDVAEVLKSLISKK